ncbi:MAG: deoxyribodipyrimidine photolyase [Alphaproteobacteria bacterium CG_4_10_14_0_2_um_filter_63_37]|nr:MAG: hypothetical protein AUJ55_06780 [Proteobacteria bacterium CG1_02_64_396]PJA24712.1 MAG: deoxyribodipyrimidine photolyase [Alphaproteobacteria bacterium CG_4_10_14_0_2_um_filter_63_37]
MPIPPIVVGFGYDLRLGDNPALSEALAGGVPVVPLYVWSPEEEAPFAPEGASLWWLGQSLLRLDESLRARGSRLIVRRGPEGEALRSVIAATKAKALYWNGGFDPPGRERDGRWLAQCASLGVEARCFPYDGLVDAQQIHTQGGDPYRRFAPFFKRWRQEADPAVAPLPIPETIPAPQQWPESETAVQVGLGESPFWASGLAAQWQPGEAGAHQLWRRFLAERIEGYAQWRDHPGEQATSHLSPHLHFGEITLRQLWWDLRGIAGEGGERFRSELGWRAFGQYWLYHFPHALGQSQDPRLHRFPWRHDPEGLDAWRRGATGYPLVDAGMREAWSSGWMHNRVRMVTASFLVKHLLIDWREGMNWFAQTLVDADLPSNVLNWQWVAGTGSESQPFFRIFNPVTQSRRFDAGGVYLKRWLPELRELPTQWIHAPWEAPETVLRQAGVVLGEDYPAPIVEHWAARVRAMTAWRGMKG